MPKYLVKARYTAEGMAGVKREGGSGRRDAVAKLAASAGGTLTSFYFAFGDTDAFVVLDLPDNAAAARCAVTIGATTGVHVETIPLMTPEEMDAAVQGEVDYRGPGA